MMSSSVHRPVLGVHFLVQNHAPVVLFIAAGGEMAFVGNNDTLSSVACDASSVANTKWKLLDFSCC